MSLSELQVRAVAEETMRSQALVRRFESSLLAAADRQGVDAWRITPVVVLETMLENVRLLDRVEGQGERRG